MEVKPTEADIRQKIKKKLLENHQKLEKSSKKKFNNPKKNCTGKIGRKKKKLVQKRRWKFTEKFQNSTAKNWGKKYPKYPKHLKIVPFEKNIKNTKKIQNSATKNGTKNDQNKPN